MIVDASKNQEKERLRGRDDVSQAADWPISDIRQTAFSVLKLTSIFRPHASRAAEKSVHISVSSFPIVAFSQPAIAILAVMLAWPAVPLRPARICAWMPSRRGLATGDSIMTRTKGKSCIGLAGAKSERGQGIRSSVGYGKFWSNYSSACRLPSCDMGSRGQRRTFTRTTSVHSAGISERKQEVGSDASFMAQAQLKDVLPHRRRNRTAAGQRTAARTTTTTTGIPPNTFTSNNDIRPDASARLASFSSTLPHISLKRNLALFLALTKPNLSFLVVLTATTAYGLYPMSSLLELDPTLSPAPTLSSSTLTFLSLVLGTFLSAASANSFNMFFEPKYDALMSRTRNRPLVRGLLSRRAAVIFALLSGGLGVTTLYMGTNPTVAGLGALNIGLYALVYTPMKRLSVLNTWVGAVVGGIPPLMGWTAAMGQIATPGQDSWRDLLFGETSPGGWLLGLILYAWQFPHFNSLSYTIREEYKNAGHRMVAWTNPALNARVALRYSVLMFPLCAGLWWVDIVDREFLVIGTVINAWMAREAYRFWKLGGAKGSARGLFWASIWHLPILMVGTLVTKKGLWDGVRTRCASLMGYEVDGELDYDDQEAL